MPYQRASDKLRFFQVIKHVHRMFVGELDWVFMDWLSTCHHPRHQLCVQTQGTYGPFQAQMETQVPLWLALALYKMKRCRINPPQWLDADELKGTPYIY